MARRFYRIVGGPTATREDFLSQKALGRPLRRATPEIVRTYDGISVFETITQARAVATRFRSLGTSIAEIEIPESATIRIERTFANSDGHHTLWGNPDEMRQYVVRIEEV